MKNKAITDKLSDKSMLEDLQALLNEELAKPIEERDLDAIKEITDAMVCINDEEVPLPVRADEVLSEVRAREKRSRLVLLRRWAAAICACAAVCIVLNCYTLRTYGSNVFEAMINMARSGFSIDTNQLREIEPAAPDVNGTTTTTTIIPAATHVSGAMTTTTAAYTATGNTTMTMLTTGAVPEITTTGIPAANSDPKAEALSACDSSARSMAMEMLSKAEEAGLYPCYPTFLPSGFEDMSCTDFQNEKLKDSNDCYFTFENENSILDITVESYYSEELMPNVLVPSDSDDYEIFRGDKVSGFIMGDDSKCTAVFVCDNTVYTLHGSGVNYNELMVIAESFVPYPSESVTK
ncbi:MAG: DUF4367 domain-containing protein [Ruminococcus sp.]|nr:DUF4367 domain-containing protein [Ruminococcus sp.]